MAEIERSGREERNGAVSSSTTIPGLCARETVSGDEFITVLDGYVASRRPFGHESLVQTMLRKNSKADGFAAMHFVSAIEKCIAGTAYSLEDGQLESAVAWTKVADWCLEELSAREDNSDLKLLQQSLTAENLLEIINLAARAAIPAFKENQTERVNLALTAAYRLEELSRQLHPPMNLEGLTIPPIEPKT